MTDYSLTKEQEKAFKALNNAMKRCVKAGIYLWDNYGIISGVNGQVIKQVAADENLDEELDDSMVSWVNEVELQGNADVSLYVEYN